MRRSLWAMAVTSVVLSGLPTAARAVEPASCTSIPVVAHRGITTDHVENTIGSVRAAIAAGVGFEVDVRTSRDGRPMLMHDRFIGRTTTGTGAVANLRAARIRSYPTDDGQLVPFVGGVLRLVRDNPATFAVLDLKALTAPAQAEVQRKIADFGIAGRVSAISFDPALLAEFRRLNPLSGTYYIASTLPTVDEARQYGGVQVWPELITEEWADSMSAADVGYNARIDDTAAGWDAALGYASGWLMTDQVEQFRSYCAARTG